MASKTSGATRRANRKQGRIPPAEHNGGGNLKKRRGFTLLDASYRGRLRWSRWGTTPQIDQQGDGK